MSTTSATAEPNFGSALYPEGFVAVRRNFFEHLEDGQMHPLMLAILVVIHQQCSWKTGVWIGSAKRLAATFCQSIEERQIQRHLKRLCEAKVLKSFYVKGQRGNYPVLINGFRPTVGSLIGQELNAEKSEDWRNPVYETVAGGDATLSLRRRYSVATLSRIQEEQDVKEGKEGQDATPARPRSSTSKTSDTSDPETKPDWQQEAAERRKERAATKAAASREDVLDLAAKIADIADHKAVAGENLTEIASLLDDGYAADVVIRGFAYFWKRCSGDDGGKFERSQAITDFFAKQGSRVNIRAMLKYEEKMADINRRAEAMSRRPLVEAQPQKEEEGVEVDF